MATLKARIEELEKRVRELEARPVQIISVPYYIPAPLPIAPNPYYTPPVIPGFTWGQPLSPLFPSQTIC